jgi:hypothetical protein
MSEPVSIDSSSRPPSEKPKGIFLLWSFMCFETGWMFNLVMSHLLFWVYGFPDLVDYGYTNTNLASNGSIPSGPLGSGVGIVSAALCVVATAMTAGKFVSYNLLRLVFSWRREMLGRGCAVFLIPSPSPFCQVGYDPANED